MHGNKNKSIPIKVVGYVNAEWMVEVMHAIVIAKLTKTRKFKVEGNKLFYVKTLLGINPCLVVLFLAKCDPIPGTSDDKTLGLALLSRAKEADALLAIRVLAPKQETDSLKRGVS